MYKFHFPEEEARLNEILEKLEDEYYNSNEHLNSVLEDILNDTLNKFTSQEMLSEQGLKIFEILTKDNSGINSYAKEELEWLLQYLMSKKETGHALNLISIYLKRLSTARQLATKNNEIFRTGLAPQSCRHIFILAKYRHGKS